MQIYAAGEDMALQHEIYLAVTTFHESELHAIWEFDTEWHKLFLHYETIFYINAYPEQMQWAKT